MSNGKPMTGVGSIPDSGPPVTNQRECVPMSANPSLMGHGVLSPKRLGHIIGEGAAIFMDMTETMLTALTETMLTALDQQMALSNEAQRPEVSLTDNILTTGQPVGSNQVGEAQARIQAAHDIKDIYPDLYLPVAENHMISDCFYGYMDSMSADNNPMILVELTGLSY